MYANGRITLHVVGAQFSEHVVDVWFSHGVAAMNARCFLWQAVCITFRLLDLQVGSLPCWCLDAQQVKRQLFMCCSLKWAFLMDFLVWAYMGEL